jgi:hypothetical protein
MAPPWSFTMLSSSKTVSTSYNSSFLETISVRFSLGKKFRISVIELENIPVILHPQKVIYLGSLMLTSCSH